MPNGLARNALAWANNATMRGGGITQRTGFIPICVKSTESVYYYLAFTANWTTPAIGATVSISLVDNYPGSNGDQGTMEGNISDDLISVLGTFEIVSGAGTTTIIAKLISLVLAPVGTLVLGGFPATPFFFSRPSTSCRIHDSSGLYQGGWMYEPVNGAPYLIVAISGRFYRVRLDTDNSLEDITGPVVFPATEPFYHFAQGEEFMVVQAGDYVTLPAFWDGTTMRQSVGLNPGPGITRELPAAGPMVYYQGRIWYAFFNRYTAGDIVRGPSGTAPYALRDSILKVTENLLALGGDGFAVPSQAGTIRALQYSANLDKSLGEGTLFIFTRQQVYALDVPVTRAAWIAASSNTPVNQRPVQRKNGGVSDRSIVAVNGDLFYQSLEPSIRSLFMSLRYFQQWGNAEISNNIQRLWAFNDRALMRFSSGINFDGRMYQSVLPEQRTQGVVSRGIATLDFDPITTLNDKQPPNWEGTYDGIDSLQLFQGDFGGRERAFSVIISRVDDGIELWEITNDRRFDNVDTRVSWYVEFPAFTWGREFDLKRLDGGEFWIDKLFGTVDLRFYYREDANPCWQLWHVTRFCTARTSCETINEPVCYPLETLREGGKFPITLPVPPLPNCDTQNSRPMNIAHQFQVKVEILGWCRIRGIILYAVPVLKQPFGGLQCAPGPLSLIP